MSRIQKILAPTDFSELSKAGLRYALELAHDVGAEVLVYHVIDFGEERLDREREVSAHPDMLQHSHKKLESFLATNFADSMNRLKVSQSVEIGTPAHCIPEKAASEAADMIVMSTHGRTGLDHLILGSATEKVVTRAPCPVLVVPRRWRQAAKTKAA